MLFCRQVLISVFSTYVHISTYLILLHNLFAGLKYPTKFTEEQIELFKSICKVDDIFNLKIVELNKRRRAYVGDLIKNGENVLELCLKNGIVEESSLAEPVTSKVATSPPEQVQDEVENVYEQPPVEAELDSAVSDMASMQLNGETGTR